MSYLCKITSFVLHNFKPIKVEVEVKITQGLPLMVVIGLPSKIIEESRERIKSSLKACGLKWRHRRVVINLSPAELKKTSSSLELAMALGIWQAMTKAPPIDQKIAWIGELSLDGSIKKVRGILSMVLTAQKSGCSRVVVPIENLAELQFVTEIPIHPVSNLSQITSRLKDGVFEWQTLPQFSKKSTKPLSTNSEVYLEQIKGQSLAKKAIEISAAGGHHLYMIGLPGVGKSLLAKCIPSLLPQLSKRDATEVTALYSAYGLTDQVILRPPFREPHHTISVSGLIGGGSPIKPGEISLAHRGTLFLDELPEYRNQTLEALKIPLERGAVILNRNQEVTTFPTQFRLVAAANPCPCGNTDSKNNKCTCTPHLKKKYHQRISTALLDRIDLHLSLGRVEVQDLTSLDQNFKRTETLAAQKRVQNALNKQTLRYKNMKINCNAQLTSQHIPSLCKLSPAAQKLLSLAHQQFLLSVRKYFTIIRVAQTLADLENNSQNIIKRKHISQALQFRTQ